MKELLNILGFNYKENAEGILIKYFPNHKNYIIEVDLRNNSINFGNAIFFNNTKNSTQKITKDEDYVVLECVDRLLTKGYSPKNIILEKVYPSGHGTSGRLDILVTRDDGSAYMMVECKTWGKEFDKANLKLGKDGGQLFTYFQQDKNAEILALYASRITKNGVEYTNQIVKIEEEYRATSNVKDLYDRWNKIPKNNGIFDDWTTAYEFISKALTRKDLKALKQEDSSFIFNRFLEILRHNVVSDKPNAFNKIFTLFLCKIIDEDRNEEDELHFQWLEGKDDDITFQKRLTDLYNRGMNELLEKKVTDISDNEFEQQFQQVEDTYKEKFREILTEIRLKKNNEFAIKEVYDDDSFNENAIVVKEIVELLQSYQIRYNYRQQFLSDFFELLLTTGLKQESGQFFTPVPIARFIIKSIPFNKIIQSKIDKGERNDLLPTIIDYSAGSGHFITESMEEVQKYIDSIDENKYSGSIKKALIGCKVDQFSWAEDYVYAIEKDYRLVKTAKVSCYLHGDGLAKVIHGDGLDDFMTSKSYKERLLQVDSTYPQDNKQFDIIVSNPPYSVSAFKTMMDDEKARKNFELYSRLTDQSSEIESLFIERTKQLLKDGGIAGIVLPSSILTGGGIYTRTREIIFKYFEIISITEFGSNTFMATGTNTVVLFLRRRNNMEHKNIEASIERLFESKKDITINGIEKPLSKYLSYVWEGIRVDDYITLIETNPNDIILSHEIYKEYTKKFDDIDKIIEIEKDKLLYFVLAYNQKVTVVKTGEKQQEKKFLGYEFSNRRGSEGIHPIQRAKTIDECTSLYDDSSYTNELKANSYIYAAFEGKEKEIDESLKENISYIDLIDMMSFDRTLCEKNILLNAKKKVKIESKWELISLAQVANIVRGLTYSKENQVNNKTNNIVLTSDNITLDGKLEIKKEIFLDETLNIDKNKQLQKNDIFMCFSSGSKEHIGKVAFIDKETNHIAGGFMGILRAQTINAKYLYLLLNTVYRETIKNLSSGNNINNLSSVINNMKIPLPPKDIQEKIVKEIEDLENIEQENKNRTRQLQHEIENIISNSTGNMSTLQKITTKIGSGATPKGGEGSYQESGISLIRSQNVHDNKFIEKGLAFISDEQAKKLDNVIVQKNDILFNITGASIARCCIVEDKYLPARVNQHVAIIRTNEKALPQYIQKVLVSSEYKNKLLEIGKSATSREAITKLQLEEFKIKLPLIDEQKNIVKQIEEIEVKISIIEKELEIIPQRKEEILKKYL